MKVASVCVALAALLAVVVATGVPDGKPRVRTTLGVVAGVYDATTNTNSWKGVPYAASTAGANRFQPPKARAAWTGEHDATNWGPGCVQYKQNPDAPAIQSEDCLHANVFAPQNAKGLPVVVWIHGGGFMEGSNIGPYEVYDGKRFASRAQVVVIAINYRLGSLGFLVSGTGDSDIPGNMGFEDQQFALAWVKANAAAFGGDPMKVTLWGESAGAMSIGLHMISPNSKGLFHRVIMESNPLAITYKEQKDAAVLGRDTCKRAGCDGCGLACMQAVPADKLMDASRAAAGSTWNTVAANWKHLLGALLDFTPVVVAKKAGAKVDTNIPSQVIPALVSGKYEQVPMITGTNLEEGQTFVYEALKTKLDMLAVKAGLVVFWPFHAEAMLDAYTRKTDTDGREPLSRVVTDFLFTCPSQQFALAGAQAKTKMNAWVYQYQHVFSIPKLFTGLIPDRCATAVCHAVELPIVFHNGPVMNGAEQPLSAAENVLSDQIIGYFGSFIRTANPNSGSNAVQWPVFNPTTRNALVLGGSFAGTQATFVQTCKRWDDVKYGAGPLVNSRFRAVNEDVETVEDEDEMDAADEVEDEVDDEDEDEDESDAEMDVEDAAEMEDFVEDEAEAERYEFADA